MGPQAEEGEDTPPGLGPRGTGEGPHRWISTLASPPRPPTPVRPGDASPVRIVWIETRRPCRGVGRRLARGRPMSRGHERWKRCFPTGGGPRWTRTTYLRGRGHPALRPAILSGMPEILRVMGQATCRGEVQRRERGSLVATLNNPTTRPPPVCPQRTSSHRPPSTIAPTSWPSSMVPSASPCAWPWS